MLARAVKTQLAALNISFVETDLELDICNEQNVQRFSEQGQFTHIVNCAAFTRVDDAETQLTAAENVNGVGPGNLASAAARIGASITHFSTDYVFDGRASEPYSEAAACAPSGAYGRTKLVGEQRVLVTMPQQASIGRTVHVIRTSWLFGQGGSNFVATMLALMTERELLRVVHDQHGRPTYTVDLSNAALQLAGIGSTHGPFESGVYHFANSDATHWYGFAKQILESATELGFPIRTKLIEPVTTRDFPRPAPRPPYSVLSTKRFENATGVVPRPWRDALIDYLKNVKESQEPDHAGS